MQCTNYCVVPRKLMRETERNHMSNIISDVSMKRRKKESINVGQKFEDVGFSPLSKAKFI